MRVLVNHLWRHTSRFKKVRQVKENKGIKFVKSGSKYKKRTTSGPYGLLTLGNDWRFHIDLPEYITKGARFVMPHEVIITPLKPDCTIISRKAKIAIFIEVTSPTLKRKVCRQR